MQYTWILSRIIEGTERKLLKQNYLCDLNWTYTQGWESVSEASPMKKRYMYYIYWRYGQNELFYSSTACGISEYFPKTWKASQDSRRICLHLYESIIYIYIQWRFFEKAKPTRRRMFREIIIACPVIEWSFSFQRLTLIPPSVRARIQRFNTKHYE